MKIKTFILTFLLAMSCPYLFGQSELTRVRDYEELVEAISNGSQKIQLSNDINVSKSLTIPMGVTTELDLNGWRMVAPEGTYAITNLGTLTIKDGYGNGTIQGRGVLNGSSAVTTAQLTIHSGIYKGIAEKGGAAVYNYGIVTIDGGEFYGKQAAIVCKAGSTMSIDCDATENQVLIVAEGKSNIAIINEIGENLSITGKTIIVGTIDERTEYEEGNDQPLANVAESVIFAKAKIGDDVYCENFAKAIEAIKTMSGDVTITLLADAELDITAWENLAIGGSSVNKITINGENGDEDYTLTFNKLNSDWNHIATKNDATLVLKNMKLSDSGYNDGPWNRYDHNFACDVELENIVSNKALAFKADAKLTNVTVTDSNDVYAIWIQANGQSVEIDGLNVDAGRGIKIDEQYVDNPGKVAMSLENATFTTEKKAAIIVKSKAETTINVGTNVDITNVKADNENVVWVDEDGAGDYQNYYANVTVNGGTVVMENQDEFVAAITNSEGITQRLYKSLQEAINACTTGDNYIVLVDNINETSVEIDQVEGKNITIDGGVDRYDFSGTIYIHGNARHTGEETLTIKNIDFYNENLTANHDYISCNEITSHERYAHNVTVKNCNFSAPEGTEFDVVPMRFRQCYDINVIGGEFTNLHSVMWATGTSGIKFNDITATDCISGISLGTSTNVEIANSTIEADKFGVRADASVVSTTTIKNCEISAFVPVIARNATANYNIVFDGSNTMSASNIDNMFCVIDGGKHDYEDGEVSLDDLTSPTGHVVVDLQDENLSYDGVYGNYFVAEIDGVKYPKVAAAIKAVEAGGTIMIVDNAQGDESATTVEANNAFTIDGFAPDYKFPIIKSNADITIKTLNTNNHITTLNNLNMVVDGGNLRVNNSVVGGAFEVNAVMSLNNSYLSGTIENNNRINVAGSSNINATSKIEGAGKFYMNAVEMDSRTKMTFANVEFEKGQSARTNTLNGVTMYAGTFNVPETVTVNVSNESRVGGSAGNSYNVIAGTLVAEKSAVEFGRLEIAQSGKLSVSGNTTVNDQYLNGNELRVVYDLNNAGTLELGDETAAQMKTLTLQNGATVTINQATATVTEATTLVEGNATLNLNNLAAALVTNKVEGLTTATDVDDHKVVYSNGAYKVVDEYFEAEDVVKIGTVGYPTLAEAVSVAEDGATIELIWKEGNDPIAMNAAVFGKTVTITGTAEVDWNQGFLFVGRGGEGDGKLIFDNANLTSASNSASYGIHVSGREKNTNNKYDGTVVIKDSSIDLDYLINKGTMTLGNSTLTVKNGFSVGGRPASETESGTDATATMTLNNNSKVVVNNHNGMGLGYEALGIMNINEGSTFETTQSFLVTANGTMNVNGGKVVIAEGKTLANNGTINVTGETNLSIAELTGNAIVLNNGTLADSYIGGRVNAFGTNNITGETTIGGVLSLGFETNPTEQIVVNITGKFNGLNVIVGSVYEANTFEHKLNVGIAETEERTTAHFGQLIGDTDVDIVNADVTYGYANIANNFNVTNSDMAIKGGVNTYFSGNAAVVVKDSEWNLGAYAHIGSADGIDGTFGNVNVTLDASTMNAINLKVVPGTDDEGNKYVVNVTLDAKSKLKATNLTNEATINVSSKSAIEGKLTNNGIVNATGESVLAIENNAASTGNYILNNFVYTPETTLSNANIVFEGKENTVNNENTVTFGNNTLVQEGAELHITTEATAEGEMSILGNVYLKDVNAKFNAKAGLSNVKTGVENYHVVYSNGAYILHPFSAYVAYIQREEGNAYFESFPRALDAATEGETIIIITENTIYLGSNKSNDLNKTVTIKAEKPVKVDYNNRSLNVGNEATVIFDGVTLVPANNSNTNNNKFNVKEGGKIEFINNSNATIDFIAVNKGGVVNVNNSSVAVQKLFADDATYNAINVTGTSVLNVEAVEQNSVVYMENVTLDENTTLPTGLRVEFGNTNTVYKTSLKGNIAFNNGTTTFNDASLTGTINVKEGAIVNFTEDTYLNSTGGTESVTVNGTLNINASGAWVRTITVNEGGTLAITGRNSIPNQYLGENDLYVRTTITNNGQINVAEGSIVTIGTASTTGKLDGNGTLTIAGDAKVYASNVAKENIANTINLDGTAAKFYAPEGLTNVKDAAGFSQPKYYGGEGEGYYALLEGTAYVAQITKEGKTYNYLSITDALASEEFNDVITLINDTKEDVTIGKDVTFNTKETGVKITGNVTINQNVTNNGNLTITGNLTNNATLNVNGTLTAETITNNGSISNAEEGTVNVTGDLTNAGTLTIDGSLTVKDGGLTNYGSIIISSDSDDNIVGTLTNEGTITVNPGAKLIANKVSNQNQNYDAILNVKGNFVANNHFINYKGATINVTGNLRVNSSKVENYGTVNVEGTSAVIYIVNNVSGEGTFNMENVMLDVNNKLMGAYDITFTGVTYPYTKGSKISGAILTNSKLKVNSGYTLDVTAKLDLLNGTLTNEGTVNVGGIELLGAKLTNKATVNIKENANVSFDAINNHSTIEVSGTPTLVSTDVTGDGTFNMTKVILDYNTTLNGANITFKESDNTVTSSDLLGSAVTVESGATLELNGAKTGNVINYGTIYLVGTVKAGDVTNGGTINMDNDEYEFVTETLGLEIATEIEDAKVIYSIDRYIVVYKEYVAEYTTNEGTFKFETLQEAINNANGSVVTITAESIEENVTVSANTTFELGSEVSAATINGKLTVTGTATFNCAEIQFTNVVLEAAAKMEINSGEFSVERTIATLGQNTEIYVAEDAKLIGCIKIQHLKTSIDIDGTVDASSVIVSEAINVYTINLGAHNAKLITPTTGLNVTTDYVDAEDLKDVNGNNHRVSYKENAGWYQLVNMFVAKIGVNGTTPYTTLEAALQAANNNDEIYLLWEDGNDPIVMKGAVSGKNVTIKADVDATIDVDWSEGWLFIGRGYEYNNGSAELTFENVSLHSVNNGVHVSNDNYIYGIHVSGRAKNSEKYNGTLNIVDSNIELSYLVNRNIVNVDNSNVTLIYDNVCMNVGGRPYTETTTGKDATAELNVKNGSTFNVTTANLGFEGVGYLTIESSVFNATNIIVGLDNVATTEVDAESDVKVDEKFELKADGILLSSGNIDGEITNGGSITLSGGIYTPIRPSDEWCHEDFDVFQLTDNSWEVRRAKGPQPVNLTANWNWFSTYINNGESTNFVNLKLALANDAEMIKSQHGFASNYGTAWMPGTLTTISTGEMYMIKMREAKTFELTGPFENYSTRAIELHKGWNWIGYPVGKDLPFDVALANLEPNNGDQIKGLDHTELAYYFNGQWIGSFDFIKGHGYMYYSSEENSFFYNEIAVSENKEGTGNRTSDDNHWVADASLYSGNMSMIAMVSMDGEVVNTNYEVAAFANGELRGSARPVYVESLDAYILMMNISGDEVEELSFKYYDVNYGTEYVLENRVNYSFNSRLGSIDEPYMLNLNILNIDETTATEISIYPNPTTTDSEINLNATCDKVEVFNALGVKVAEYQNVDSIDALETAGIYVIRITNEGNVQNCRLVVK